MQLAWRRAEHFEAATAAEAALICGGEFGALNYFFRLQLTLILLELLAHTIVEFNKVYIFVLK